MNKKANTLLFILGATVFNILVTIAVFIGLLVLYVKFIVAKLPEAHQTWAFTLMFVAAIVLSFLIYRVALKFLLKKITMEKYFDPIFGGPRKKKLS